MEYLTGSPMVTLLVFSFKTKTIWDVSYMIKESFLNNVGIYEKWFQYNQFIWVNVVPRFQMIVWGDLE